MLDVGSKGRRNVDPRSYWSRSEVQQRTTNDDDGSAEKRRPGAGCRDKSVRRPCSLALSADKAFRNTTHCSCCSLAHFAALRCKAFSLSLSFVGRCLLSFVRSSSPLVVVFARVDWLVGVWYLCVQLAPRRLSVYPDDFNFKLRLDRYPNVTPQESRFLRMESHFNWRTVQ